MVIVDRYGDGSDRLDLFPDGVQLQGFFADFKGIPGFGRSSRTGGSSPTEEAVTCIRESTLREHDGTAHFNTGHFLHAAGAAVRIEGDCAKHGPHGNAVILRAAFRFL